MEWMSIPGYLFADDLAISSFAINGLQKLNGQVIKCGGKGTK
jgi:hypothetical protein